MALSHPTRLRKRLAQSLMFVVMATALAVVPAQISVASAGGGITAYLSLPFVQGPPSSYGVKHAKAAPALGAVCVRGGATARDGVSGRGLTCVQTRTRGLRWRFAPTALTTTTTTTTTATSSTTSTTTPTATSSPTTTSTTTTTVPGVVAPVLVSVSVSDGVQIKVAGMRPDTGVYSLQWVPYGQNFNRYQMARATSPSMRVPAEWLACSHTYTFRVFVMQADWQLDDGHQTQNVTSQSTPFDVVTTPFDVHMPACTAPASATASATTPAAPATCATGGACVVGGTGPGGGIVFYVQATGTFACGATLASQCKYLEVAPNTWNGGVADPTKLWAVVANNASDIATIANDPPPIINAQVIGLGYQNSEAIVIQGNNTTTAAGAARAYGGGSKSDWYLPTAAELNLLCQWARGVAQSVTTVCTGGTLNTGTGASGGFSSSRYFSSSERSNNSAWMQEFTATCTVVCQDTSAKSSVRSVRPVRAFG